MSPDLHPKFIAGEPPFSESVIVFENLTLKQLSDVNQLITSVIENRFGRQTVFRFCDWLWHEGGSWNDSKVYPLDWEGWTHWFDDLDSLAQVACEDYVHTAVFPQTCEWYLRFHVWEEDVMPSQRTSGEETGECTLDFSCLGEIVDEVSRRIKEETSLVGKVQNSVRYFESYISV